MLRDGLTHRFIGFGLFIGFGDSTENTDSRLILLNRFGFAHSDVIDLKCVKWILVMSWEFTFPVDLCCAYDCVPCGIFL